MDKEIKQIGEALASYAKDSAEFSAQRGLTEQLFPYIYQASRRMSTRAISSYLQEAHKVKLSAVTIGKALRNADKYWLAQYEEVEPAARVFGEAHNMSADEVLGLEENVFQALCSQPPILGMATEEQGHRNLERYEESKAVLQDVWFAFDEDTRGTCLDSIPEEHDEGEEGKKET